MFFTRPGNSQILRALVEDSPLIADAVQKRPEKNFNTDSNAADWFARRIKYQRINNRKVSGRKKKTASPRAEPFLLMVVKPGARDMVAEQGHGTYPHGGVKSRGRLISEEWQSCCIRFLETVWAFHEVSLIEFCTLKFERVVLLITDLSP